MKTSALELRPVDLEGLPPPGCRVRILAGVAFSPALILVIVGGG